MAVRIDGKPLAGFDQPLEMLCDCHRRVEHFLDLQLRVAQQYQYHPLDHEARAALENSCTYFTESAPKHTADEEESLFPRMRQAEDLSTTCQQSMQRLEDDHKRADQLHADIEAILRLWLHGNQPLPEDRGKRLIEQLIDLRELYREHIRIEEQEVFPEAAQTLVPRQLFEVGDEMRKRRGFGA